MSRYLPTPISDADLGISLDPLIGGEAKVYASNEPWINAGVITQPEANSGVLALEPTFQAGTARDFQVIVDRTNARSAVEMSVTLAVTFADNTSGTATATFAIPERSPNQFFNVGQGTGTDLIGVGAGLAKQIKAINAVSAVVGGDVNNRFRIVALPDEDTYFLIGCTNEAGFQFPVGASIAIPCGLNPSAFVKRGRGEPGKLTVTEKYVDYQFGLGRVNGAFVSAKVVFLKDERVNVETIAIGKWKPMVSPKVGDGDDVATAQAEGHFETFGVFTAK